MCDLLVIAADRGAEHPVKQGEILDIRPTGFEYGTKVTIPPVAGGIFIRVTLLKEDGVTPIWSVGEPMPERLAELREPDLQDTGQRDSRTNEMLFNRLFRRIWRVRADTLPVGVRQQLNLTGSYAVKWSTVKAFIENRVTLGSPDDAVVGQ